jgi:hypothetical protein
MLARFDGPGRHNACPGLFLLGPAARRRLRISRSRERTHCIPSCHRHYSGRSDSLLAGVSARTRTCCSLSMTTRGTLDPFENHQSDKSTFATIRLRHRKTKGSGSRRTGLAMTFKLAQSAQKRWRRLNGHDRSATFSKEKFLKMECCRKQPDQRTLRHTI